MNIKKIVVSFLIMSMCCGFAFHSMAQDDISVVVDGNEVVFDVPPQIINDRTMVPLRAIFESLGAEVEWDQKRRMVFADRDDVSISFEIGTPILIVNGNPITIDSPPCIVNDRTLVPVRAISEAYGLDVKWDDDSRLITISSEHINELSNFEKLKSAIKEKGVYVNGSYVWYYDFESTRYSMSYAPVEEKIQILSSDQSETLGTVTTFLLVLDNLPPELYFSYKYGGHEYGTTGKYVNGNLTVIYSDDSNDNLKTIVKIINSSVGCISAVTRMFFDIDLIDLGISY